MKNILKWFNDTFKDTWVSKIIQKLFFSLDNDNKGLSGKKLTAFSLTYCIIKMHEYYISFAYIKGDFSLMPIILGTDFATILTLFGINEYGKNKKNVTEFETITTQTDTTTQTNTAT